jgi:hypothetical protein
LREVPLTVPVRVRELKQLELVTVAVPVTGAEEPLAYCPWVALPETVKVLPLLDCSDP